MLLTKCLKCVETKRTIRISHLIVALLLLSSIVGCRKAVNNPSRLIGRWQYCGQSTDANLTPSGGYKDITATDWVLSETSSSIGPYVKSGGTYTLDGDTYTETVKYGSNKGKHFTFQCRIEGNKWYHTGTIPSATDGGMDYRVDEVWQLISATPSPTKGGAARDDMFGTTDLMSAKTGDEVKALIAAGAEVNATDKLIGETALMSAARDGRADCVTALIAAGADVNAKDKTSETALMRAASEGHADCVKVLTVAHADANTKDGNGFTALMNCAFFKGNGDCVTALVAAGADVNARLDNGTTALMLAASKANADCVRALVAARADVNAKDNRGTTALMAATSADVSTILRAAGATQ